MFIQQLLTWGEDFNVVLIVVHTTSVLLLFFCGHHQQQQNQHQYHQLPTIPVLSRFEKVLQVCRRLMTYL